MKNPKRGYLLHAFESKEIDYGKLAVCCALSIKTNLKYNHVTVVMDTGTKKGLNSTISPAVLKASFDKIITPQEKYRSAIRKHFYSPWDTFTSDFDNQNRVLTYQYSPYDETILLDVDFLVMNDSFDYVWGNPEDILMNYKAIDLHNNTFGSIDEQRVSPFGIPLYWATMVYFKKTPYTKTFFELTDYIRDEYHFFQFLYGFKEGFYRNDHSFSIAAHVLNGYIPYGIKPFPEDAILTSYPKDGIAEVLDSKEIILLAHDVKEPWKDTLVNTKGMNVHVMNKRKLEAVSDKFIESCMEKL